MPAYVHAALAVAFIGTLMIISALSPDESDEVTSEEALPEKRPIAVQEQEELTPKSPAAARAAAIEMTVDVPPPSPATSASDSSAYSVSSSVPSTASFSSAPSTASFSFSSFPSTPRTPSTPGSARRTAFVRQLQRRAKLVVDLTARSRRSTPILVGLRGAGCAKRSRRRSTSRRSSKRRA